MLTHYNLRNRGRHRYRRGNNLFLNHKLLRSRVVAARGSYRSRAVARRRKHSVGGNRAAIGAPHNLPGVNLVALEVESRSSQSHLLASFHDGFRRIDADAHQRRRVGVRVDAQHLQFPHRDAVGSGALASGDAHIACRGAYGSRLLATATGD